MKTLLPLIGCILLITGFFYSFARLGGRVAVISGVPVSVSEFTMLVRTNRVHFDDAK